MVGSSIGALFGKALDVSDLGTSRTEVKALRVLEGWFLDIKLKRFFKLQKERKIWKKKRKEKESRGNSKNQKKNLISISCSTSSTQITLNLWAHCTHPYRFHPPRLLSYATFRPRSRQVRTSTTWFKEFEPFFFPFCLHFQAIFAFPFKISKYSKSNSDFGISRISRLVQPAFRSFAPAACATRRCMSCASWLKT